MPSRISPPSPTSRSGQLQPEDIERALAGMTTRRAHAKKQEPAAPKTVRNVQVFLRRALGQAEQRGHITRNVAKLVPLRRVPRHHVDPLTPERARAILAAVKGDRYEAAYALAFCGLRAAEILGLAWADLDEGRTVATIRYQLAGSGPRATRVQLKTAASEQPVPSAAVRDLAPHRPPRRAAPRTLRRGRPDRRGARLRHPAGSARVALLARRSTSRTCSPQPACRRCASTTCATAPPPCSSVPVSIHAWRSSCYAMPPRRRRP